MCNHQHNHHHEIENANRTLCVIMVAILTMVAEVVYGFLTNSMALLSDGWHMGTHALALSITYIVYVIINKIKKQNHNDVHKLSEKISALGGYTSSLFLLLTAFWIIFESAVRFFNPLQIAFNEAILIAIIGLVVNLICVFIMEFKNEDNGKDYNYKAAYFHILTDALTSIFAIVALFAGKYLGWVALDSVIGILAGILILKWSIQLIKGSAKVLLDSD